MRFAICSIAAATGTMQLTLDEEGETNKKLTELAENHVNQHAATA